MRGEQFPKLKEMLSVTYKPDYQLIPKDEEALWWKRVEECPSRRKIIDRTVPLPPLLRVSHLYWILISYARLRNQILIVDAELF